MFRLRSFNGGGWAQGEDRERKGKGGEKGKQEHLIKRKGGGRGSGRLLNGKGEGGSHHLPLS